MLRVIEYIAGLFVLLLLQIYIFDNINLWGLVNPYVFIAFIILLPMEIRGASLVAIGCGLGWLMDLINGTAGMFAMVTTWLAFARPVVLNMTIGRDEVNTGGTVSTSRVTQARLWLYLTTMVLIFNAPLFMLEQMNFVDFDSTLLRIGLSTLVSTIVIFFMNLLLKKN